MTGEVIDERPYAITVLAAATGASTGSDPFYVRTSPVCVRLTGAAAVLAGAEIVQVQYQDNALVWHDYVHALLGNMQLAVGETALTIYDTGKYRVTKTVTAAATGVEIAGREYS